MKPNLERHVNVESKRRGRIRHLGVDWILFRVEALQGMIEEVNKVLGTGGSLVWYTAGKGAGKSMTKIFQKHLEGEESFEDIFNKVKNHHARWGWGRIKKVFLREKTGEFIIRIHENAFARGQHSSFPSCYFLKGYMEGLIEKLTGKHATSEETKCMTKGDPYCEFQITTD
jgi:predicted hydrocarbon binding protein